MAATSSRSWCPSPPRTRGRQASQVGVAPGRLCSALHGGTGPVQAWRQWGSSVAGWRPAGAAPPV